MEGQELQDIDKRLKRLENIHMWGAGIVLVGLLIFFLTKKGGNSSPSFSDGGNVGSGGVNPNVGSGGVNPNAGV